MTNSRDIYGDGHGFVDVPVGRRVDLSYRFNYNLKGLDAFEVGEDFLGLYILLPHSKPAARILWRATRAEGEFRFVTRHGSEDPHYVEDPIAWARMPLP